MASIKQTMIYVGLNDSVSREQIFKTEKYLSILKTVCRSYRVAFSVDVINGGYFHDDGTFVDENSLVLTLMDTPDETIRQIASDLCAFFHQESVMVTKTPAEVYYIRESIKEESE